ncbi:hypothetical protein V6D40_03800 [Corynebacterium sp. Q4381]|uniref:hypothetical protein n=1 Tax=Corynebacterium sp. Marseille-Q4381 TaxID=3121597 RepID=UPI002FE5B472
MASPDFTVRDSAEFEDPRSPLTRALKFGGLALVALAAASLVAWGVARDLPGIWGVIMGVAIGGGAVLATALSALATSNSSPSVMIAVVLGGWVVKMVVLGLILHWLRSYSFYDPTALAVTTVAAVVVAVAAETWAIVTARTVYITPK